MKVEGCDVAYVVFDSATAGTFSQPDAVTRDVEETTAPCAPEEHSCNGDKVKPHTEH